VTTHAEPSLEGAYADVPVRSPQRRQPRGKIVVSWLTSTDHKVIGYMYLITSFVFFLFGGVLALIMRAELARPGLQFVSAEQYNQLFTMHGTVMLLMFATPLFVGFGNVIMALLSRFWLHEAISLERWAGIVLITVGVGFVAQGPSLTERPEDGATVPAEIEQPALEEQVR